MDHHTTWLNWLPGYSNLHALLNKEYSNAVYFPFGSHHYETVHHIYAGAVVVLFLMLLSLWAWTKTRDVEAALIPPRSFGIVAFFELMLDLIMGMMKGVIGEDYKRYVPMIGTLGLFILCSNLLGLVPGMAPPTDNLNTSAACAIVVFVWFNFHGLRDQGIHHITHVLNPIGEWWGWFLTPLLGVIEVLGLFVRPVALALRLAGNMIGDHKVLFAFAGIFPFLLPLPFYALGLMVCVIQAAVFCILSTVYIGLHTGDADH